MKYDNAAGRLLEILSIVKTYDKSVHAREVWTTVFDLPKNELSPLLTAMLAKTMMLPLEALNMLEEEHPDLASPPPSWVLQVSSAFQVHNVHGPIETFSANISPETLANIRTTAVLLDKGSKRKLLSGAELAEMQGAIEGVLKDVLDSDQLNGELRTYLARALRKVVTAIQEYKLTGATPILESIEQAVGHVMVDPDYRSFLSDSELGKRVFEALQAASSIVTVAGSLPMLTQAIYQFLK